MLPDVHQQDRHIKTAGVSPLLRSLRSMLNKVVKSKIYTLLSIFDFESVYKEQPRAVARVFSDSVCSPYS